MNDKKFKAFLKVVKRAFLMIVSGIDAYLADEVTHTQVVGFNPPDSTKH